MSWEALRLTSRTPSEVYATLGPHGVEELLRDARNVCWREHPTDTRTVASVKKVLTDVFDRNMKVWESIKKPTPESFFRDLLPHAADGHIRQALVLTWMMMRRAGGRKFSDSSKIVRHIFNRMLENWGEDDQIFTKGFKTARKRIDETKPIQRISRGRRKASKKRRKY